MNDLSLLKQMTRIPTYEEKGMKKCSAFLKGKLKQLGFKVEIDKLNNVFAVKKYGKGKNFLINAHFDTVSPGSEWKTDPLKPVKKGGRIYGLGTTDDKGSIACLLSALSKLEGCKFGTLYLLLSSHEDQLFRTQKKNWNGAEWFLKKRKIPAKTGLVLEPSNLKNKLTVRIGCGGSVSYEISAKGVEVHSSRPNEGVNAIYNMFDVISEIRKMRISRVNLYENKLAAQFSVNLIRGGRGVGIIPGECTAKVQRRLIPTENGEKIAKEFENKMNEYDVKLKQTFYKDPYLIEPTNQLVKMMTKSVEKVVGRKPKYSIILGGTDATYLKQINGTNSLIIGPGENPMCHKPNEYIDVNRMEEFTSVLVHFMGD